MESIISLNGALENDVLPAIDSHSRSPRTELDHGVLKKKAALTIRSRKTDCLDSALMSRCNLAALSKVIGAMRLKSSMISLSENWCALLDGL